MASIDTRFLLVDENPSSRDAVANYLRWGGFCVEVAINHRDCAVKLRTYQPDVLVVGLEGAGEGDGERIVAMVNEQVDQSGRPFLLVLGDEPVQLLSQRVEVPRSCCFERPVRWELLMNRICMAAVLAEARRTSTS